MAIDPASRLILPLDFPSVKEAEAMTDTLGDTVTFYKIGLELLFRGGMDLAEKLLARGNQVFIDAKLLDIGNTVEKSVANIASTGANFLTIHGTDRKTMSAAVHGRGNSDLKLLAVTVLTSLEASDLNEQGCDIPIEELVLRRAAFAKDCCIDGVVASGLEAAAIRKAVGSDLLIVTPGIRPPGADAGDQSRVMTPERAIEAGADYLVVGRPITQSPTPKESAQAIIEAMDRSFRSRDVG